MDEKKRPNLFLRALAFLVTAALVLGAVFLVANWQKLNFDSLKRWFTYRSLQKNEAGQAESFPYGGGDESCFALSGKDLLVCSTSGARLYAPDGSAYIDQTCRLDRPMCAASGTSALVYDAGGVDLFVYKDRQQVWSYAAESGRTLLSASLSEQGLLTTITRGNGLKCVVTTYDSQFQKRLDIEISSRFVTDAVLSPDGTTLAVATAGQSGGSYDSQLAFYAVSRTAQDVEPDAVCSLGRSAVLQLRWSGQAPAVLTEDALTFVSADGTVAGSYPFNGRFLKGCSMDGDGFTALLLGKYRAGTASELVLVDQAGEQTASLPVTDQVLSLSAGGHYVCLLSAGRLNIYTKDLEPYCSAEAVLGARRALQHADGSVTLITGETARLYLPN